MGSTNAPPAKKRRRGIFFLLLTLLLLGGIVSGGIAVWRQREAAGQFLTSLLSRWGWEVKTSTPPASPAATAEAPRRYQMEVFLDPAARRAEGNWQLSLRNETTQSLTELYFHLYPNAFRAPDATPAPAAAYRGGFNTGGIEVREIKVEGRPAAGEVKGTILRLPLERPLQPGKTVILEMQFQVDIPGLAYRFGQDEGVTVLGNWYPLLAVYDQQGWHLDPYLKIGDPFYSQMADYKVSVVLPTEQVVAATGWVEKETLLGQGKKRVELVARQVRDFALVCSDAFQLETKRINGITLRSYSWPQHAASARQAMEAAASALLFFSRTYHYYPYPQFSLVEVPMNGLSGMEYPLLVMLNSRLYAEKNTREQWESLVAHEVAHQWWYNLVGSDQFAEPWLDEGMAVWAAEVYLREQGQGGRRQKGQSRSANGSPGKVLQPLAAFSDAAEYYALAYYGGSLFWEKLEERLGAEKVKQIWRRIASQYCYRELSTAALLQLINEAAGENLQEFCLAQLGVQGIGLAAAPKAGEEKKGPDLAIAQAVTVVRGESMYVVIQVENRGTEAAGSFSVEVEEDRGKKWEQRLAGLPPGKSYTFSGAVSGPGTIRVDCHSEVEESDEENNRSRF